MEAILILIYIGLLLDNFYNDLTNMVHTRVKVYINQYTTNAHSTRVISLSLSDLKLNLNNFILFSFIVCTSTNSLLDARNYTIWTESSHSFQIITSNSTDSTQDIPIICYTIYR